MNGCRVRGRGHGRSARQNTEGRQITRAEGGNSSAGRFSRREAPPPKKMLTVAAHQAPYKRRRRQCSSTRRWWRYAPSRTARDRATSRHYRRSPTERPLPETRSARKMRLFTHATGSPTPLRPQRTMSPNRDVLFAEPFAAFREFLLLLLPQCGCEMNAPCAPSFAEA